MSVPALVLAAGAARRFGADKRLARLPSGYGVLETTVSRCLSAGLPTLVVIDRSDAALDTMLREQGVDTVTLVGARSGRTGAGMGDSLATGVARVVEADYPACLVVLGDMPWVRPDTLRLLCATLYQSGPAAIVAPVYSPALRKTTHAAQAASTARGHPVGFGSDHFAQLLRLSGDAGARKLVRRHAADLVTCPVDDPGVLRDVDTPRDLLAGGSGDDPFT